jgi:maleylacetate reductase
VANALGRRLAARFDGAAPHVPVATVDEAMRVLGAPGRAADVVVAVGGGSAIGLAKALALRTSLPIVALPTTYAGSEMTNIWGVTEKGAKQTGRDQRVLPAVVIYDPALTLSLPPDVSAASGMNAMAHAVEAVYAHDATAEVREQALGAARLLADSLPDVVARPSGVDARERALRGAHLAGAALGHASMGLHHRLCHVLGGRFGLPHALTHAVVLPHVVAFNAPAAPEAIGALADALGVPDAAAGLAALNERLGLTARLRHLGLGRPDLDAAAARAADGAYGNPRAAAVADVRAILAAAY